MLIHEKKKKKKKKTRGLLQTSPLAFYKKPIYCF